MLDERLDFFTKREETSTKDSVTGSPWSGRSQEKQPFQDPGLVQGILQLVSYREILHSAASLVKSQGLLFFTYH